MGQPKMTMEGFAEKCYMTLMYCAAQRDGYGYGYGYGNGRLWFSTLEFVLDERMRLEIENGHESVVGVGRLAKRKIRGEEDLLQINAA